MTLHTSIKHIEYSYFCIKTYESAREDQRATPIHAVTLEIYVPWPGVFRALTVKGLELISVASHKDVDVRVGAHTCAEQM